MKIVENEEIYEGQFDWDFRHGVGRLISSEGKEVYVLPKGRVFKGYFDKGKFYYGIIEYNSDSSLSSVYRGESFQLKRHGEGKTEL